MDTQGTTGVRFDQVVVASSQARNRRSSQPHEAQTRPSGAGQKWFLFRFNRPGSRHFRKAPDAKVPRSRLTIQKAGNPSAVRFLGQPVQASAGVDQHEPLQPCPAELATRADRPLRGTCSARRPSYPICVRMEDLAPRQKAGMFRSGVEPCFLQTQIRLTNIATGSRFAAAGSTGNSSSGPDASVRSRTRAGASTAARRPTSFLA